MEENRIEGLLVRYYNGELEQGRIAEVERWMRASAENRRLAEQVYYLCFSVDALQAREQIDTAAALGKVRSRIRTGLWRRALRRFERAAAILLLPLAVVSAWLLARTGGELSTMVEIRSTTGMVSVVTLPDATRVWLNSDSYLRYPARFTGDERRVTLYGEGYFDVAKDARRKFVVAAHSAEIEVYGTEFNVEAYDGDHIRTTLVSGRVGMKYDDASHRRQTVRMLPDQQAIYNARTGILYLNEADVTCNTSWKEGKIVLHNTSLEDALRMIGNKYNVQFLIRNDNLRSNKFTGTFSNQSLDVILRYFNLSSNIRFKQLDEPQAGHGGPAGRAVFEVL
ncbi:FecR domain-containing protein [Alistipes sp.]|uniref:FecR domain-containing protein n=1 Tax=Alistipes sp. TaxID=1872444 RepID=UPI003AEF6322